MAEEFQKPLLIHEIDVGDVEGKLISGELDFGLAFVPSPKPELEYLEIGEVQFSSHAREDLLKESGIDKLPFAVPISEFPQNPLGYRNRDGWPADVPRTPHYAVSGFAIALDLLRAGRAALYMPDFVAALENARAPQTPKIVAVKEHRKAQTKRKLLLVKRQTAEESPEMKKAAKVIRRICCARG